MSLQDRHKVAPPWHTACVLALLTGIATFASYVKLGSSRPRLDHVALFVLVTASEWAIFAFCLWRSAPDFQLYIRRSLRDGHSPISDILAALMLSAVTLVVVPVTMHLLGKSGWGSVQGMQPRDEREIALWIVMAISAGVCEETVYRGYLQQQFSAWTQSTSLGVVIQAVLFSLVHAYQGPKYVLVIFVVGCLYGVAAVRRRGLRANMIAHACLDIAAAF